MLHYQSASSTPIWLNHEEFGKQAGLLQTAGSKSSRLDEYTAEPQFIIFTKNLEFHITTSSLAR